MTQRLPKSVAMIELADGTELGPVRVGLATKLQASKTAKAKGWDMERDAIEVSSFMAWHAAKHAGLLDMTYEDYTAQVFDAGVFEADEDTEAAAGADAADPTGPAA